MRTKIEKIELRADELSVRKHFIERFVDGLGDPENYDYTGEVVEDKGYCVCGHPILYQFGIKHKTTGRLAWVGSVCINYFQQYNRATYEALSKALVGVQDKIKELKKKAREAVQDKEIERLSLAHKEIFEKVCALAKRFREQKIWLPYWVYKVVTRGVGRIKEYTRKCDYIRAYKKAIEVCEKALADEETKDKIAQLRY